MKTRRNNMAILRLLFAGIFFSSPFSVSAQDYIKEAVNTKTDKSVIRCVDSTRRLVYNEGYIKPAFMMFTDASTTTQDLYLPDNNYSVSDFIVRDNMVYFCGKKKDPSTNIEKAIMGHFDLTNFPSTTVYYYTHEQFSEFRKIESYIVYSASESEFHIVMTARNSAGRWTMVDSYELPYNRWGFYSISIPTDSLNGHSFLDIAVTDSYVLATSSYPNINQITYLWYFIKPTVFQSNAFSVEIKRRKLSKSPKTGSYSALVGDFENNRYITTFITDPFFNNNNKVMIEGFNGIISSGQLIISSLQGLYPREIRKNHDSHEMDILLYSKSTSSCYFFHLPQPTYLGWGSGFFDAQKYSAQNILSFDYLGSMSDCFIASGYGDVLKLYKYKYDNSGICAPLESVDTQFAGYSHNICFQEFVTSQWYYYRTLLPTTTGTSSIGTTCGQ